MKNLNEEINKIKHLFNFKKGDVITESLLNEGAGGGCKCPDGTIKPECCNTAAQKHARAMKNVKSKDYFQKNPKGTITMDTSSIDFPSIIMINGSKDGIDETGDTNVPSFYDLWNGRGEYFGRAFGVGSTGKYNYVYRDNEIHISAAKGNEGASCTDDEYCFYVVDERENRRLEKMKNS